jgi:hypothetical protein
MKRQGVILSVVMFRVCDVQSVDGQNPSSILAMEGQLEDFFNAESDLLVIYNIQRVV